MIIFHRQNNSRLFHPIHMPFTPITKLKLIEPNYWNYE
ncbi:hypothetical protein BMETH_3107_0 [methanotrophic bacterial endosymbiont of Bathymodiolus sp.]|nr:hypothetical protein BMETH_3107_0 [methanotrophic bacterial endosymbiont of Bathymodiolus sp.]